MTMLDTLLEPQRRQKAVDDQAKLQAVYGPRLTRMPAQSKYLYGLAREKMALDQLSTIQGANAETSPELFALLAEGLALQAKFEAAAEVAPEGPHKDEYLTKAAAVAFINEQQCGDPLKRPVEQTERAGLSAEALREHPDAAPAVAARQEATQLPIEKVWTGKQTITFTRCIICGAVSAYA